MPFDVEPVGGPWFHGRMTGPSSRTLHEVKERLSLDAAFAAAVRGAPIAALAGYDLSAADLAHLEAHLGISSTPPPALATDAAEPAGATAGDAGTAAAADRRTNVSR